MPVRRTFPFVQLPSTLLRWRLIIMWQKQREREFLKFMAEIEFFLLHWMFKELSSLFLWGEMYLLCLKVFYWSKIEPHLAEINRQIAPFSLQLQRWSILMSMINRLRASHINLRIFEMSLLITHFSSHNLNLTDFFSFSFFAGVGIVLVTISGVAWRMTIYDSHQCTGRCGRRQCSRGNSSFGLLYPEFQHRPPPPSYQASMQEYRLRWAATRL